ncbi:MAG: phosphoenolpyruvate carboxylase [Gammaproteobacteria bacterium]|nr:phosphoenolpyruvate carboxylase [Gammaproteobacteria bacterium]
MAATESDALAGIPRELRDDVRLLGDILGRVIGRHRGAEFVDLIEDIRALAKAARRGSEADWERLSHRLADIPEDLLPDIARAFNQFLNLANIAEQCHAAPAPPWPAISVEDLTGVRVELVLTAHPTEVLRRTLIQKYDAIGAELAARAHLCDAERRESNERLERLISEAWHTDEIRRERPSPEEEARWGFAVIENSLWDAVPKAMRDLDAALPERLSANAMPFSFASWMGGDRDGNPGVTAAVTRRVLRRARWTAADLLLRDVNALSASLSMSACTDELRAAAGGDFEPYRAILHGLRDRLFATRAWAETDEARPADAVLQDRDVLEPLLLCHRSLVACGMERIAEGPLLDTLRRVHCFGVCLARLDIRQHAERHEIVLDEVTRYLQAAGALGVDGDDGPSGYAEWDEPSRVAWLLTELQGRRPLFPREWPVSEESREVLDTCRVVAENDAAGIATYVISMATAPSDVLAVALLLRESGLGRNLAIVPLFETLDDLNAAAATLDALLSLPWYRAYVGDSVQVMIGYSDSAKDAGQLAAAWAQYRAQEAIAEVAARHGVRLTLFHGRGGAIGRGGGPSGQAIASQPPGSMSGSLRVTEQGEMIRFKLGAPQIARATLSIYLQSTLRATVAPPPAPVAEQRSAMTELADACLASYRGTVRNAEFVELFHTITPEGELADLSLGSRPARRAEGSMPAKADDLDRLRAIPWVFAWTQIRLMLPPWLGADEAVRWLRANPSAYETLRIWPFFAMQFDMLAMVLAKADTTLARYYARRLADAPQQRMTEALIARLESLRETLPQLDGSGTLLANDPAMHDSILVRNTYLDPLHLLQAELMARRRAGNDAEAVRQALNVTMAGIASGLRNTG